MTAGETDERTVPDGAPADRLDKAVAKLFGVSRGRAPSRNLVSAS